jgi:hypothetical protein
MFPCDWTDSLEAEVEAELLPWNSFEVACP